MSVMSIRINQSELPSNVVVGHVRPGGVFGWFQPPTNAALVDRGSNVKDSGDYLLCNHLAPLKEGDVPVEAFMFKFSKNLDPVDREDYPDKLTIIWHDGTIHSENLPGGQIISKFLEFYSGSARESMELHEDTRRDIDTVSVAHAVNVANFHAQIGLSIKASIQADHSFRSSDYLSALASVVEKLDWLYYYQFISETLSDTAHNNIAFAALVAANKWCENLKAANPEYKTILDTITKENEQWTLFELRHLLRITINDYYQSLLEGGPLQSHFSLHTTLLRLDNALSRLVH